MERLEGRPDCPDHPHHRPPRRRPVQVRQPEHLRPADDELPPQVRRENGQVGADRALQVDFHPDEEAELREINLGDDLGQLGQVQLIAGDRPG